MSQSPSNRTPHDNAQFRGPAPESPGSPAGLGGGGWRQVAGRVRNDLGDDQISVVAAGVAFFGLLAIFPAIATLVALYGLFADPQTVAQQIQALAGMLPASAQQLLQSQLERLTAANESALGAGALVGILLSLWSASKGIKALVGALNIAYGEREERGFVKLTALVMALTLGAAALVLAALVAVAVVPAVLGSLGLPAGVQWAVSAARWPLLLLALGFGLAVLYRFAPDRRSARWQWVSPGAAAATVLWLLASLAFSFYVSHFASYNETYGSLAGVIVLLLWLYISAFVVLLGAEVNAEAERQTAADTTAGARRPRGRRGAAVADGLAE